MRALGFDARHALVVLAAATAAALLAPACADPVHSDAVDALGPEVAGVREGPEHRAGQPCLTCHGGDGPGPDFVTAGTVYDVRGGTTPLPGVSVILTDATGKVHTEQTNRVGNFYVEDRRWSPVYPLHVRLEYGGQKKEMETRIGRNGGCAYCHRNAGSSTQMPAVYMREQ